MCNRNAKAEKLRQREVEKMKKLKNKRRAHQTESWSKNNVKRNTKRKKQEKREFSKQTEKVEMTEEDISELNHDYRMIKRLKTKNGDIDDIKADDVVQNVPVG